MKVRCIKRCFFKGKLYREGEVYSLPEGTKLDAEQKSWFEVLESKKKPGPKPEKVKDDSTADSESSTA
ncbi:MAG: hypothetical protein K9L68_13845 [Spirochaetales bacterium]|nr:hypothetical protein [Spirochaetales bacterium]